MDFTYLNRGEKIAGIAGVLLILVMFVFKWFGVKVGVTVAVPEAGSLSRSGEASRNAWGSYGVTDIVLFITALTAVAMALTATSGGELGLPVALSAIVTALGIVSVVLVVISIVSPPSFLPASGEGIDYTRKVGVWLGLAATAAVTVGGYLAMQDEGTSFAGEADRVRSGGTGPSGPPQSSQPPPSSSG